VKLFLKWFAEESPHTIKDHSCKRAQEIEGNHAETTRSFGVMMFAKFPAMETRTN